MPQSIEIEPGVHLSYEEYGSGDEIFISAQMNFAEPPSYESLLAEAPVGAHFYAVTLRGFAPSSLVEDELGVPWFERWADDVALFAEKLGIERFIYTGASHGSGVGWYVARRHPHLLKGLVAIVSGPHDRDGDVTSSVARRSVNEAWPDEEKVRDAIIDTMVGPLLHPERRELRERRVQEIIEQYKRMHPSEARINQGKPFPEADTDERLAAELRTIDIPTLLLAGMQDLIISPKASLRAAVSIPGAKAVFWQDEGHMMQEEIPEKLIREVAVFVDELNADEAGR